MGLTLLVACNVLGVWPEPAAAQTVPPPVGDHVIAPPAGSAVVQAAIQTVAPAGMLPLGGPGVIALVPSAAPGSVAQVTADLGNGVRITVLVPADQTPRYVRLQLLTGTTGGQPATAALPSTLLGYTFELRDGTGAVVRESQIPLTTGIRIPPPVDLQPLIAARYDEPTAGLEFVPTIVDPSTRVLQYDAPGSGTYYVGIAA